MTERYYDPTLAYRVEQIEEWRKELEQSGIPVAFARIESRLEAQDVRLNSLDRTLSEMKTEVDGLQKDVTNAKGFFAGWKAVITIGLVSLIMVGNFVLSLVSALA